MTALSWVRLWFWQLITRLSYFSPFSSPEPVVSWSRGRETRVGHTVRLEIKPSGSGDENDFPRCFVQNKELLFSSVGEPLHDHGHIFAWPIFSRPLPFLQCQKVVTLCFHLPPPPANFRQVPNKSFFLSVWYPKVPSNKPQTNPKDATQHDVIVHFGFPGNMATDFTTDLCSFYSASSPGSWRFPIWRRQLGKHIYYKKSERFR